MDEAVLAQAYRDLRADPGIDEVVLLSTCNRVEAYALLNQKKSLASLENFMGRLDQRFSTRIKKALYRREGEVAVHHLLKVASSLDSMVVGESQILGQVKAAYQRGIEAGTVGKIFHGLFHRVFSAAKEVRSETEIGRHAASVPSVAVNLAEQVFGDLSQRNALLLGAGEMAELCAEYLKSAGVKRLVVANRTLSRAKALAKRFNAEPASLEGLGAMLAEADVVLSSVGGKEPLLTRELVGQAEQVRSGQPQLIVDISVPRSVEPSVNDLEMVYSYNVDSLQQLAEKAQDKRVAASRDAEHLLGRWKAEILAWFGSGRVTPTLQGLNDPADALRSEEFEKARKQLKHLSDQDLERVEYMSRALVKKILHQPLRSLRDTKATRESLARNIQALEDLFGLKKKEDE